MNKYEIRELKREDITQKYVDWFQDPEVIRYSDNQYRRFSLQGQIDYVETMKGSSDRFLYGIFDEDKHIGNVVLGPINLHHQRADVNYVVGDRDYWGKGVGTYAVTSAIRLAKDFGLRKVCAGCAKENIGSRKVLERNGFQLEGIRINHLLYNGEWMDQLDFGLMFNN